LNPIEPASNEAIWTALTILATVVVPILLVIGALYLYATKPIDEAYRNRQ
jgi:hypothetical protein